MKNCAFKINHPQGNFLISNFDDFWVLKNITSKKKKVYNLVISHENRVFCLLFVEIIAYIGKEIAHLKIFKIIREKSQTLSILDKIIAI